MDGLFVSAFHRMLKPDPAIFLRMCEEFSLDPEECFFIDDIAANIEGAAKVGMRGVQFPEYDVEGLRHNLRAAGIRIWVKKCIIFTKICIKFILKKDNLALFWI